MLAVFLVLTSGLLHAIWNLFAKQSLNKVVFLWSLQGVAVLAYLPWAMSAIVHRHVSPKGWLLLGIAALLHGIYVMLLARTYTIGDLSHVYPLMRGVSPLLVPIIAVTILGERLSSLGWLGVGYVVMGIWVLGNWDISRRGGGSLLTTRATWLALLVGLSIATYTTFDKVALQYVPAVTLNDASNLGNLVSLSWVAIRSSAMKLEWKTNWKTILLGESFHPEVIYCF